MSDRAVFSPAIPRLSLILPAYNERERLPGYLRLAVPYLNEMFPRSHEVIVVDDGSRDRLEEALFPWRDAIRLLRHPTNLGKGAAVRTGMEAARGALRLFADADGSTPIEEERRLRSAIEAGADLAIGSRAKGQGKLRWALSQSLSPAAPFPDDTVVWEVQLHRYCLGRLLAAGVRAWLSLRVADTQCGFKMFRAETAMTLFSQLRIERFAFDLELLYLASRLGYRIEEVPVHWRNCAGSKVNLLRDSLTLLRDLARIRRQYRDVKVSSPPFRKEVRI